MRRKISCMHEFEPALWAFHPWLWWFGQVLSSMLVDLGLRFAETFTT
jgi:hypothetical protein